MNKEKEDFFLHSNEVNYINREDYEKIELLVNAAKAFARSTYQCVYIIDYFHQDFIYASDNLAYLCGLEPEQLMEAGYQMYIDHVPDADLQMLRQRFSLGIHHLTGDILCHHRSHSREAQRCGKNYFFLHIATVLLDFFIFLLQKYSFIGKSL